MAPFGPMVFSSSAPRAPAPVALVLPPGTFMSPGSMLYGPFVVPQIFPVHLGMMSAHPGQDFPMFMAPAPAPAPVIEPAAMATVPASAQVDPRRRGVRASVSPDFPSRAGKGRGPGGGYRRKGPK
ncbi:MAG: hypothetical protein KA436_12200 [Oligoflexales bacterium]|nr:hypothetical protein [Oligoflexales bacterium]